MNAFGIFATWLASGFGSGYARVAPGTFGSFAALIVWLLLYSLGALNTSASSVVLVLFTSIVGTVAVSSAISSGVNHEDPQWIVIDEWAGLYLALIAIVPGDWMWVACAFVLFRLFDASKIGPIGWAETLPGSFGIMADDLVAGAATALVIWAVRGVF